MANPPQPGPRRSMKLVPGHKHTFQAKGAPQKPRHVYLTFDDGPNDGTPDVLSALEKTKIKAAFFLNLGDKPDKDEMVERLKAIVAGGHLICSHTAIHDPETAGDYAKTPVATIDAHLRQNVVLLGELLGKGARFAFVRLPGDGRTFVGDVAEAVRITQAPHASWDAELVPVGVWNKRKDLLPWPGLPEVKSTTGLSPGDGAILLLHDAHWEDRKELLIQLLSKLQEEGYTFAALTGVDKGHPGIDWPR